MVLLSTETSTLVLKRVGATRGSLESFAHNLLGVEEARRGDEAGSLKSVNNSLHTIAE